MFRKALEAADMTCNEHGEKYVLYSLRHTYATEALVKKKVDAHTLSKQMGTSINMIEQHYSHLIPEQMADDLVL